MPNIFTYIGHTSTLNVLISWYISHSPRWCIKTTLHILFKLDILFEMLLSHSQHWCNILQYSETTYCVIFKWFTLDGIMFVYFRFVGCHTLEEAARTRVQQQRALPVTRDSFFLVPHVPGIWGSKDPLAKEEIVKKIVRVNDLTRISDLSSMKRFLQESTHSDVMIDPGLCSFGDMITPGAPLLDFMIFDSKRSDCWNIPSSNVLDVWKEARGVSYEYVQSLDVREFVVGVNTERDMVDFRKWIFRNIEVGNEVDMDCSVLSFDVEEIPITLYDLKRMSDKSFRGTDLIIAKSLDVYKPQEAVLLQDPDTGRLLKDEWLNLPAKIMMGDGIRWVAMISFDIIEIARNRMVYNCHDLDECVLQLLEDLPVVQGLGIRNDVMIVEKFCSSIGERNLTMKGFVELQSLAVLAGWQLQTTHMTAMSLIVTGGTLNKCCSKAGGIWGIRYDKLPWAFKVYAVADLKFGYMTYAILVSLLLRQMFPDPDICCKLSKVSQVEYVTWFARWIRDSIYGTAVFDQDMRSAETRFELMMSLKYRNSRGHLSVDTPERVQFVAHMVHWPTLTAGGPRYLQPVRFKYLEQYQQLAESGVFLCDNYFANELTEADYLYASFGHLQIELLDNSLPVPGWSDRYSTRLVTHPHLDHLLIHPDHRDLAPAVLFRAARAKNRDLPEALLEWFRLDIRRIPIFFQTCERISYLSKSFRGKYESYRLMHLRLSSDQSAQSLGVPLAEESISTECARTQKQVDQKVEKLQLELAFYKELKERIDDSVDKSKHDRYRDRFEWKVWAMANQPIKSKMKVRTRSVSPRSLSSRKRSRSRSCNQDQEASRSSNRAPDQKRGRPLTVKQGEYTVYKEKKVPVLVSRDVEVDEHPSGGRFSKPRKGKGKGKSSGSRTVRMLTQDEIEEEPADYDFFGPDPTDDLSVLLDD